MGIFAMRIKIDKLVQGGSGMGEIEGRKVFVPYSAPGDIVDIEITADHGDFAEAKIVSILEPAPCRVTPKCPVFGDCGGCQWQHIDYRSQLVFKREILQETLIRIGKISNPNVVETHPSPRQWNYRNRIQLHVDSKGRVGFYRARSKEVVEFARCEIADERLNCELASRRSEFSGRDRGIALRVEEGPSFSQINTGQNEEIKRLLVECLRKIPHESILELYAGAGNFSFSIAKVARHVVASDIDGRACNFAFKEQRKRGIKNIEFLCAPADLAAKKLNGQCDVVIVDPPRKGCAEAIDSMVALGPKSIIYISCNPATLARDALELNKKGYVLDHILPIDMFPQTSHIESMSLFSFER